MVRHGYALRRVQASDDCRAVAARFDVRIDPLLVLERQP